MNEGGADGCAKAYAETSKARANAPGQEQRREGHAGMKLARQFMLTSEVVVSRGNICLLLLGHLSLGCTSMLGLDDGSDKCVDETGPVDATKAFRSKNGELIDVPDALAQIEGSSTGTLTWVGVARETQATLGIERLPTPPVTLYYDCGHYEGLDVPAHLTFSTSDGAFNEGFTGQLAVDDNLRLGADIVVAAPPGSIASSALREGQAETTQSYYVWLTLRRQPDGGLPFASATLALQPYAYGGKNGAGPWVIAGEVTFTPP